jgi:hypothetical protein
LNIGAQYVSYVGANALANVVPNAVWLPLLYNPKVACDFVQASSSISHTDRADAIASLFVTGGLITKSADIPTNIAIGTVIAAFVQYMNSTISNSNIFFMFIKGRPFIFIKGCYRRLTTRHTIIIQLLFMGVTIVVRVSIYAYVKLIRASYNKGRQLIASYKKDQNIAFLNKAAKYLVILFSKNKIVKYKYKVRNNSNFNNYFLFSPL